MFNDAERVRRETVHGEIGADPVVADCDGEAAEVCADDADDVTGLAAAQGQV